MKQLLLGENGSGKSSLLMAIRQLKAFIQGGTNPFTQSSRTRWQDRPLQVFEIEAQLENQQYSYRVEIIFTAESRQSSVSLERLNVSGEAVFELANGDVRFFPSNGGQPTSIPLETTMSALHLAQLSNRHVQRFVRWMESVHCFRIDEYPSAMEDHSDKDEPQPDDELENLAGWYRYLVQTYPDENVAFITSMREAMAGFQALRFSSDEDGARRLRVDISGPGRGRASYALFELSEGQRCLLALYMILCFLIAKGRTVFIDEPDNFIALREIQPWLLAAEESLEDHGGQLILISHHPEILNQWAARHGLRFFREDNGHVRTENFHPDVNGNLQPAELIARGWQGE
jgi:predicted ATPase